MFFLTYYTTELILSFNIKNLKTTIRVKLRIRNGDDYSLAVSRCLCWMSARVTFACGLSLLLFVVVVV